MDRSYRMFPNLPLAQRGTVQCVQNEFNSAEESVGRPTLSETCGYTCHTGYTTEKTYPVVMFLSGFADAWRGSC